MKIGRITLLFVFFAMAVSVLAVETIKVGGFQNYPIIFKNDQGKVEGIFPDLLAEIARQTNFKLEFQISNFSDCLKKLENGSIYLMTSITPTEERKKIFNFSSENVLTMWGQVFLPTDSDVQTILDLNGKRVGLLKSGINAKNFIALCEKFQIDCDFFYLEGYKQIMMGMQNHQLDAGIFNNVHGESLTKRFKIKPSAIVFSPFPLVFATRRGMGKSFLKEIDQKLSIWKKDKDSFFFKTLKKWYGDLGMGIESPSSLQWFYGIIAIAVVLTFFMFILVKILQAQIRKRTVELNEANLDLMREIEDRKQAEKIILAQKEEYRAVTEASSDFIMRYDQNCVHTFANQRAIQATGFTQEEYIGKTHEELGFPDHLVMLLESNIHSVFETGLSRKIEFDVVLITGEVSLELNLSPEFNEMNKIVSVIGVARDISHRKKTEKEKIDLEKRLQHSHRLEAIGTLAGGIAHDINNILTPILGYSELISAEIQPDDPNYESLCEIHKAAIRGKDLARQILIFSRQPEPNVKAVKIQEVVMEALKLLRATLPTTISIETELPETCPRVAGDPSQIHQVLMNLITNASYAMKDSGGVLRIFLNEVVIKIDGTASSLQSGRYVCLTVSDTGLGMKKEVMDRIFEPYYTTKPKEKGSGLGLSMVHGIISKSGGKITVNSSPGEGTEFKVFFPVASAIVYDQQDCTSKNIIGGEETILVVDDEEMIVKLEERLLSGLGYKVVCFTESCDALAYFKSDPAAIDLILTDMTMPEMTGDKLAIEAIKARPDVPIIICTGFSENISQEKTREIGVKALMIKPVTLKELAEKIRSALDVLS